MCWRSATAWTRCASSCCASFPFGSDGNFSNEAADQHASTPTWPTIWAICCRRTTAMVQQVLRRHAARASSGRTRRLDARAARHGRRSAEGLCRCRWSTFAFQNALQEVFKVIGRANKYIDENAPWALAKDMEANGARLAHVLYNLLESHPHLRHPADPLHARRACEKLFAQIGAGEDAQTWEVRRPVGRSAGRRQPSIKGENLFPRIDAGQGAGRAGERRGRGPEGRSARRGDWSR